MELFEYTPQGYQRARQWLAEIGELEKEHDKYFRMDGIQLIMEANRLKDKQVILLE